MSTQALNIEFPCDLRKRIDRLKTSRDDHREKNREKARQIKKLNDKIFDTNESREKWRNSYEKEASESLKLREYAKDIETELYRERQLVNLLRIEIEELKKSDEITTLLPRDGPSVYHCWYPILMVLMCVRMVLRSAISLRGVPKAIHEVFSCYVALMAKKVPSYKTVRRWIVRLGHYKLYCPLEQSDDWAVVTDASIQIGEDKCLMVLGIRLSQLKRGKALSFEDYFPLVLEMHKQCNAKTVDAALRQAQLRVGKIRLICADQGPDIVAGIRLYQEDHSETSYIRDITHRVAVLIKHELKNDEEWARFCKEAAQTKSRVQQTGLAHLSPPNQRSKCRFMNMEALVGWGRKMLCFMEKEKNEKEPGHDLKAIHEHFGWLYGFSDLLKACSDILEVCQMARHLVRTDMIDRDVVTKLEAMFESIPLCDRACQVAGEILDFLAECAEKVPHGALWIGSSEVIESLFGKLKSIEHDQNNGGFTSLVLSAAACVGAIDIQTIDLALNNSKDKDIVAWEAQNLGVTVQAKRKQFLINTRQKSTGSQEEDFLIAS